MENNINIKFDSKNKFLKIIFLEIFPPINELIKPKEEFNIIFQGNDNFFDFKPLLLSKTPIQLPYNKKSLIMTLLKNNNIFATGLFTIRQGEQNIFFNFENNKKGISNKIVNINNLSDCIKLKIFCEIDNNSAVSTINRNTINTNYENNSDNKNNNKYVTKVNLMKPIRINNYKNKVNKKIYDKKKRLLNSIHQTTNNSMKKNFVNDSRDLDGDYTAILTEEMSNIKQNLNSNYDIQKINKIISNTARKNESSNKGLNRINKAKSKNFLSTNKKLSKNYGKHIKMNNSSLNLINQSNKLISSDNYQINNNISNNRNYYTNRNSLKSNNTSFNTMKRNSNNPTLPNKSIRTSLNNYISGKIIEHVNSNEKINYISINKNLDRNNYNKDIKKIKSNGTNITMNSISTAITKKNDLEFSMNSLQDYEDKNLINNSSINKSTFRPFTNRTNNDRLSQKISGGKKIFDNTNKNVGKHKYNKSLCQQSFTDKIFCENNEEFYNLCKSETKLKINYNEVNENKINNNNNIIINIEDKEVNIPNNNYENKYTEEEIDMDNNYTKLKEDFNLLYNLEYVSKINEDLMKLEVELFIEKMSELFTAYHTQMDEKILEKKIINREYKINFGKYILYNKLKDKLEIIRKRYKEENKNNIAITQYKENTKTNMNEIDIFKIIFPNLISNEDKNEKLKNILSIIMKKKENKELIGEKYDKIKTFI